MHAQQSDVQPNGSLAADSTAATLATPLRATQHVEQQKPNLPIEIRRRASLALSMWHIFFLQYADTHNSAVSCLDLTSESAPDVLMSISDLTQAEIDANRVAVYLNIAAVCLATGRTGPAVHWCGRALEVDRGNVKAHLRLARAHLARHEHEVGPRSLSSRSSAVCRLVVRCMLLYLPRLSLPRLSIVMSEAHVDHLPVIQVLCRRTSC